MTSRTELEALDRDQLADELAAAGHNTRDHDIVQAEVTRRAMISGEQIEQAAIRSAVAMERAADAAEQTAKFTRGAAAFMALSAAAAVVAVVLQAWWHH